MRGQPHATHRPESPACISTCRCRGSPDIHVMMGSPSTGSIQNPRRSSSCITEIGQHIKQWLMTFTEITDFRWPVIHLRVDVDRVVTVPWRLYLMIPDSLQIGRLAARTRTSH